MALVISTNRQYQKANVPTGFEPVTIWNESDALDVVSRFDWTPAIFRDGHRKIENFMESVVVAVDVDNTGDSKITIEQFQEEFDGIEYWIFTSKSHKIEKLSGKKKHDPEDRFHAIFPLDFSIRSPDEYRSFLEAMILKYPWIDSGAKDGARFFYGFKETQVLWSKGKSIKKPEILKKRSFDFALPDPVIDHDKRKRETYDLLKRASESGAFDCRDEWISCGMAMKAENYSFDQWMQLSWDSERQNIGENQKRWDGFRSDSHSAGTLVRFARIADPGFLVKKNSSAYLQPDEKKQNSIDLAMPWERWFQPHVVVTTKKDPETKEFYDIHSPKSTIENFEAMINFYGIEIKENLMRHSVDVVIPGMDKKEGKHENAFTAKLMSLCVLNGFSTANLDAFIISIAHKKSFHPVKNWLASLEKWDKKDRIRVILDDVLSVKTLDECPKLPEIILKRWLVSCVAAVFEPRYRGRGVLTFQGEQEIGKTSFFKSILPKEHFDDWFKDGISIDQKDKDSIYRVVSHWIVELGEIEGMFRKEISSLKAFITSDEDLLRLPYERKMERYPRRTIMCATVNDPNFLNDPTGSSRFWVLATKKINYRHDLDVAQLWSQAVELYKSGERWWLEGEEKTWLSLSNSYFYELDSHEELIKIKYDLEVLAFNCVTKTMLPTEIVLELGLKPERKEVKAVSNALRALGVKEGWCHNRSKGFIMPPLKIDNQESFGAWRRNNG